MRVLMVAPEATPFVKTGGLGDVLGALPAALQARGEQVAVVLPRYRTANVDAAERIWDYAELWIGPHRFAVSIDQVIIEGVRYFFIDCPPLYDRAGIYNESGVDYPDNHLRFAALAHAALFIARNIFRADVLHAHDWQSGLVALLLRERFAGDPTFFGSKTLLTIHNVGYQGNFPTSALPDLGLDSSLYHPEGIEFWGQVSFLKAGIVWSDAVNTVSPTYAREIQTPEYGFGFDGLLRSHAHKLSGILNGVDYHTWSPESDTHIAENYSVRDLSGKRACKQALLAEMDLPRNLNRPLIGIVSRFAEQKGLDLVAEIAAQLAQGDVALAVLGSGEIRFEDMFRHFHAVVPDKFGVSVGYNEGLAHRIEAGSDMFLMPSRYEPCGLNQIYSLRYGTPPIVRATGGLDDTVDQSTGFKFGEYAPAALWQAVRDAMGAWHDQTSWTERMKLGMAKNFSWDVAAAEYQRLYRSL